MKLITNEASYYLVVHQNKRELPYLMLFHGFMGTGNVFEPLIKLLTKTCNPITADLLGHGKSSAPAEPTRFTAELQASDLISILDRLQFRNLFLYGYSMGGRLAQHLFVSDPSRFSGLILESTHCGITDENERKIRKAADEKRAKEIECDYEQFLDRWIELPLFDSPASAAEYDYKQVLRNQNPKLMAASLRGFGAGVMPPVCGQLREIKKPVGMLTGKSDQKYVDKMGEMAQLCSRSDFKIIDGAGHRVHVDQPNQTAKFITQFLNQHG